MGLVWINGPDFGIAQLEPPTVQDVLLPQPEEPWGTMGNVTRWGTPLELIAPKYPEIR